MSAPGSPLGRLRAFVRARTDAVFRSFLKNSGWAAFANMGVMVVSYVETAILAHRLSLNDTGVLFTLASICELVYGLLDFRTGEAVIKFLPEVRAERGNTEASALLKLILFLDAAASAVGFVIIAVLGWQILSWMSLKETYFVPLLVISGGLAVRGLTRSAGSYLRICGRFDQASKLSVWANVFRLAVFVFVGLTAPSIPSFAWASTISWVAMSLLLGWAFLVAARDDGLRMFGAHIGAIAYIRRPLTKFLLGTNLAGTLRILSTKLDAIVIAWLMTPAMVAIYRIAGKIASGLMVFSDPLLTAIYPELSKLHVERKSEQLHRLLRTLTLTMTGVAAALIGGFALFGDWFIRVMAGDHYEAAYPVTLIMIAGTLLGMIFFWARPLLLVRGHAHSLVPIAVVAFVVQFGALYLLAPTLGPIGAGISFALYYVAQVVLFLLLARRTDNRETIDATAIKSA